MAELDGVRNGTLEMRQGLAPLPRLLSRDRARLRCTAPPNDVGVHYYRSHERCKEKKTNPIRICKSRRLLRRHSLDSGLSSANRHDAIRRIPGGGPTFEQSPTRHISRPHLVVVSRPRVTGRHTTAILQKNVAFPKPPPSSTPLDTREPTGHNEQVHSTCQGKTALREWEGSKKVRKARCKRK